MGNDNSEDEFNSSSRSSSVSSGHRSIRSEGSSDTESSQDDKRPKTKLEKVEEKFRMEDEELARDGSRNKFIFCLAFVFVCIFLACVGIYFGIVNSKKDNIAYMKEKARKMTTSSTTEAPKIIGYG